MGQKVLADKRRKLTILTTKPANEQAPTATELNAGLEACLKLLVPGTTFKTAPSDTIDSKGYCGSKEKVFTDTNVDISFRVGRYFLDAGGIDPTDDALFAALVERGATLWAYERVADKSALTPWAANDEIVLGARITPDWGSVPDDAGWIVADFPISAQDAWPWIKVAAGA